ncbi:MAG: hypothetical protein L6R43_15970, partial [Planctomycetes bacterium]|nr:hypothetical protein [Planctomycetota bacterium]
MEGARPAAAGWRLAALPFPARLLLTLFLAAAGAGYAVGMLNAFASHGNADGRPGLSVEDLRRTWHGRPGWTLLASKVDGGSMERHVPIPSEKRALLDWAAGGGHLDGFDAARAVLDARCLRCHSPGGQKGDAPFGASREAGASHALVARFVEPDRGMGLARRATTTHAHLLGMGTLFAAIGAVFLLSDAGPRAKALLVAAAYGGLFLDIGSWWLAIPSAAFVWTALLGAAIAAAAVAAQITLSLRAMWVTGTEPGSLSSRSGAPP